MLMKLIAQGLIVFACIIGGCAVAVVLIDHGHWFLGFLLAAIAVIWDLK